MSLSFCMRSKSHRLAVSPPHLSLLSGHYWTKSNSSSTSGTRNGANNDNNASSFQDPFVIRHLSRLNIPKTLHNDMIKVLEPVYDKPLTVSHLKSFGKDALLQLASSIQASTPKSSAGSKSLSITWDIPHHSTTFELEWKQGLTLLETAKMHPDLLGEYMEGTCGGSMSCCTCHVYLSDTFYNTQEPPTEAELDMLDLAYEPKETSRLACQVHVTDAILAKNFDKDDLIVTIPSDIVNVWK